MPPPGDERGGLDGGQTQHRPKRNTVGADEEQHHFIASSPSTKSPNGNEVQAQSASPSFATSVGELFTLGTRLLGPHLLHPLQAVEVYHPGLASMWPFNIRSTFHPATGIPSLAGKVILVTGGNNGIGKETVAQFARHGADTIFLAARSEPKAREAIAAIQSQMETPVNIEYLPLDLTSLPSVKDAADRVVRRRDRLDILVLNAGIMAVPPGRTASGQDIQMGTNHVGHFLLTKLLLPTLTKTAAASGSDVRIVAVSSEAWHFAPPLATILDTDQLVATDPWTRYGASKASNIMFAAELARRHPELTSVSLHPGIIKTDLYLPNTQANPIMRYGSMLLGPLVFQTIETGALNQLWAAAGASKHELQNGSYYTPVGRLRSNQWASDADAGRRLWEWTEHELKTAGY